MRLINRDTRTRTCLWLGASAIGLGAVVVFCVLLNVNDSIKPSNPEALIVNEPGVVAPSSLTNTIKPGVAIQESTQLPILDFPPGSIEEACELNKFPPHWATDENLEADPPKALESAACRAALESHIGAMNPYLFFWGDERYHARPAAFIVLENPLTFARIFADPAGDLARVQEALSRSECLLKEGSEVNSELKESCHAEAFLNYALVNRFCYEPHWQIGDGVSNRSRTFYWAEDNPTPEQDRFMWKQDLEDDWVEMKCGELDPSLELTSARYTELSKSVLSLSEASSKKEYEELLIELAARLGDDAAGLTQPLRHSRGHSYGEEGYKHGRFAELLSSDDWQEFSVKKEPTVDRFLQTFRMLARLDASRADPRDEIEFDWEWVARHLCAPPYSRVVFGRVVPVESVEHQSCQEIVHEIRQQGISFLPLTLALDKFEQVALELEVYE